MEKRKLNKPFKIVALVSCLVIVASLGIGVTMAWFTGQQTTTKIDRQFGEVKVAVVSQSETGYGGVIKNLSTVPAYIRVGLIPEMFKKSDGSPVLGSTKDISFSTSTTGWVIESEDINGVTKHFACYKGTAFTVVQPDTQEFPLSLSVSGVTVPESATLKVELVPEAVQAGNPTNNTALTAVFQ